jgi:uncharacterized protein
LPNKLYMSNLEKVTQLMESGAIGPLSQVIVMEALRSYCERVLEEDRPTDDIGQNALISNVDYYDAVEAFYHEYKNLVGDNIPNPTPPPIATVIYHGDCLDGFGALWSFHQLYPYPFVELKGHYGPLSPEYLHDCTGRDVFLVDFSYKYGDLLKILDVCRTLTIIDHHKTAAHEIELLRQGSSRTNLKKLSVIFDLERSGASLTWEYLCDSYAGYDDVDEPELIKFIQDRDLWIFDHPETRLVTTALFAQDMTIENWNRLMLEPIDNLIAEGTVLRRQFEKNLDWLEKHSAREMEINGYTVLVANAPPMYASELGNRLAEGRAFSAVYSDSEDHRNFSLRSTESGQDVSAIAQVFGGGGHKHAAGFKVPRAHTYAMN